MTENFGCYAKIFIIYLVGSKEPLKFFELGRHMITANNHGRIILMGSRMGRSIYSKEID